MENSLPSASAAYVLFFLVSVGLLILILCARIPDLWRSALRLGRQMIARRTRRERMLADPESLEARGRKIEGLYRFEAVEAHASPSAKDALAASSDISSASSAGSRESIAAR